MKSCNFRTGRLIFFILRYFAYNMMYYRISKNEKNLFFGKKIAQVWAVTLNLGKKLIWSFKTFIKHSVVKELQQSYPDKA